MIGWNEEIKKELGSCGKNVFIGHNVVFTNPKNVHLGDNVRIDPFTLITTALEVGNNVQICSHAVLGGGSKHKVTIGDWCFIGYGSKLFCASEDYSGDFGPVNEFWGNNKIFRGDITFEDYSGIASDVMVMPGVTIPEGCTIGAKSFIYSKNILEPWNVYLGNPLTLHKPRNKENVINLSKDPEFLKEHNKKKCAKVIACYLGPRRRTNNNPENTIDFMSKMIENEINMDNGYDTDVIIAINNCGDPHIDSLLEKYNGTLTKNGKIIVYNRENYGASFGCYFDSFLRYKQDYTHWFFCEDDVLVYREKYMKDFVDFFESDENIGFVSLAPISTSSRIHSGGGCGLVSREWMTEVYPDENIKQILYNHRGAGNNYGYFELCEIDFTETLTKNNRQLKNHPEFNNLCMNWAAHSSQGKFQNNGLEFIYSVGV